MYPDQEYQVQFSLKSLTWTPDQPGAEDAIDPYLWVVFFKIDADGFEIAVVSPDREISPGVRLYAGLVSPPGQSAPTLKESISAFFSQGSHGNLGGARFPQNGGLISIPPAIGQKPLRVSPIPVSPIVQQAIHQTTSSATFGFLAVLFSAGNGFPNSIAETGHAAFNQTFISAISSRLATLGQGVSEMDSKPSLSADDTDQVSQALTDATHNAEKSALLQLQAQWQFLLVPLFPYNVFQLPVDAEIGSVFAHWTDDEFSDSIPVRYHEPLTKDGYATEYSIDYEFTANFVNPSMRTEQAKHLGLRPFDPVRHTIAMGSGDDLFVWPPKPLAVHYARHMPFGQSYTPFPARSRADSRSLAGIPQLPRTVLPVGNRLASRWRATTHRVPSPRSSTLAAASIPPDGSLCLCGLPGNANHKCPYQR